ncbi:MAG: hypothetical protein ACR2L2_02905 [Acidobacteriota bacterium]
MKIFWSVRDPEATRTELAGLHLLDPAFKFRASQTEHIVDIQPDSVAGSGVVSLVAWADQGRPPDSIPSVRLLAPSREFFDELWCCQVREWPVIDSPSLWLVVPDTDNEEFVHPYFRQRNPGWCGVRLRVQSVPDLERLETEWVDSGALATGNRYLQDRALLFYRGALVEVFTAV